MNKNELMHDLMKDRWAAAAGQEAELKAAFAACMSHCLKKVKDGIRMFPAATYHFDTHAEVLGFFANDYIQNGPLKCLLPVDPAYILSGLQRNGVGEVNLKMDIPGTIRRAYSMAISELCPDMIEIIANECSGLLLQEAFYPHEN